jgi:hypothetical protein
LTKDRASPFLADATGKKHLPIRRHHGSPVLQFWEYGKKMLISGYAENPVIRAASPAWRDFRAAG